MHVFFSGIGGVAMGPLALIAKQVGFQVSGSDKQATQYIEYLKNKGITDIHIGQSYEQIKEVNKKNPIDWYVYSSAVAIENPDSAEFQFCREQSIKTSKRDQLINQILQDKKLKLIAVAGTHGKTTTTGMVIWLFKQLGLPVSYSLGAKISFGEMGQYQKGSEYFIYEADEFDRNFLSFEPHLSLISGISWDHHEIYPTREDYQQAFAEFINQSHQCIIWQEDVDYLKLSGVEHLAVQDSANNHINDIQLKGLYNRLDGWLAVQAMHKLFSGPMPKLISLLNSFPGLSRRMEKIKENLFSDDAHTPEKIKGAMSVAIELAAPKNQRIVVIYEPLTNRRQHYILNEYKDCFAGASQVYWLPTYLAREDPGQKIISASELIANLDNPAIALPIDRDEKLAKNIKKHLLQGDMVICISGGGGNSLDEWIRRKFSNN